MGVKQIRNNLANSVHNFYDNTLTENKRKLKLSILGTILFAVLLGLFIITGLQLARFESERYRQQEIESVQLALDEMRTSLTNRIYSNIYKTSAVKALVAMNQDLTQDDFARAMEVQFMGEHDLRNIGLARDMILEFMYPIEGNEAAVGLDYRALPDQLEAVELALSVNEIVVAGPLTLVQGGEGLIARIPIEVKDLSTGQEQFWGFASVVMNSESLFAGAGLQEDHNAVKIAIRGRDALGAEGEIFWGDPVVFENNPLTQPVELPYGSWQMAAIPSAGWGSYSIFSSTLMWIYFIAAFVILSFSAFFVIFLGKMETTKHENVTLIRSLEVFLKQSGDFIYYKDANSRIIFCSQTLADITNHNHWKEMIGKHDFEVFPYEVAKIYHEEEKFVFEEGKPLLNKVNPYYRANGETGYVQTNKWPVFDEHNKVSGIFGISRDITDQKKNAEALEKERNLFAAGPVFNMEWDPEPVGNWSVKYVSSNAEDILGYSPAEMLQVGFSYSDLIHPDDLEQITSELKDNIANHIDSFEQSYRLKTRTGRYLWIYNFTRLLRDEGGNLTAIRSYMYDQSAQKNTEEALRIAEARLEKTAYDLTENIPIGTYTMVQPTEGGMAGFSFMSSRFLQLTGLSRDEAAADPLKAFACVHPEDYDEWVALNARVFEEKTPFYGETRVVADGEVRWVTAESFPRTLPDGTTVWEGVLADITDRKRAEEALSESLERFNDLVAHVSVGVYVFWHRADGSMEFEYVSDGWCRMNQINREDVLADPAVAFNIIHPEDLAEFIELNQEAIREKKQFYWEGRIVLDGVEGYAMIESTPLFFDNGDSRWFGIQQDITERKKDQELLRRLATVDELSQLYNRRYFMELTRDAFTEVANNRQEFAVLLIDIDRFKAVNDNFGHAAGDAVIRELGLLIKKRFYQPAIFGRLGGEEFGIHLPNCSIKKAVELADSFREELEQTKIVYDNEIIKVTISIGVSGYTPGIEAYGLILRQADEALYQSKLHGRNRVSVFKA